MPRRGSEVRGSERMDGEILVFPALAKQGRPRHKAT